PQCESFKDSFAVKGLPILSPLHDERAINDATTSSEPLLRRLADLWILGCRATSWCPRSWAMIASSEKIRWISMGFKGFDVDQQRVFVRRRAFAVLSAAGSPAHMTIFDRALEPHFLRQPLDKFPSALLFFNRNRRWR